MKRIKQKDFWGLLDAPKAKTKPKAPKEVFFEEFDEGTQLKLQLFEDYLTSWLPVFLEQSIAHINIVDFFAGRGQDGKGNHGSPLKALEVIRKFEHRRDGTPYPKSINLFFNDRDESYISSLKDNICNTQLPDNIENIKILNTTFETALEAWKPRLSLPNSANFVFIDPFGILPLECLKTVGTLPRCDFLIFAPLNNIYRLCETPEFEDKLKGLRRDAFDKLETAHRVLCNHLHDHCFSGENDYKMYSFAIQKGTKRQRHCLIFGSKNILGLYKFIRNAWKHDPENGEANFKFSGDLPNGGFSPEISGPAKVRAFQDSLREEILQGNLKTNSEIFHFALAAGFHPPSKQVKDVLKRLRSEGLISVNLSKFALGIRRKGIESIKLLA